jgi:hypothetical protein
MKTYEVLNTIFKDDYLYKKTTKILDSNKDFDSIQYKMQKFLYTEGVNIDQVDWQVFVKELTE